MRECKGCGRLNYPYRGRHEDYGFCHSRECIIAQKVWLEKHWRELPDGKMRTQCERRAMTLTPKQMEKHAYFFSLIRPRRTQKDRRCLRCREIFKTFRLSHGDDNRICAECHAVNRNVGALASC